MYICYVSHLIMLHLNNQPYLMSVFLNITSPCITGDDLQIPGGTDSPDVIDVTAETWLQRGYNVKIR